MMSHGLQLKNCLYKAMQADLERQFETLIGSVTHSIFFFFFLRLAVAAQVSAYIYRIEIIV